MPFGGVNVITVGDLYQLKPVMGQFVFEDYRNNYGPLATNLWTEHFKIYELTEIMRQKDDKKFAQLLNRLRIGAHTKNDIKILKSTKTKNKHLKNKNSIPHFYPTLQQVNLHNEKVTKKPNNFCIKSRCTDILPASISKILETNINTAISKRKITHTGGLPQDVTLITNEQYDLISNIDVEDGLINGAQCIIKYIQTTQKMMTFFHTLYGQSLKTKTLVQISIKNMHICTPHRLTDNGCLLLKSKEHLLLKTAGFIGYNFHYVRQLHVQYMFHKVLHIQKYMLT